MMAHSASLHTHRATASAGSSSSTAKASATAKNGAEEGGWTFRAPRHGDLVRCPYCDPDSFRVCDHCGGEGSLFTSEVFQ